jgi:hypothetical protein
MFYNITYFDITITIVIIFISIDFLLCGYFGLTTNNVEKMPHIFVRHLMKMIKIAEINYKGKEDRNSFVELFTSLQAFSVYFLIGGFQQLISILIDFYSKIIW